MRILLPLLASALLWSCGSGPAPAPDTSTTAIDTSAAIPVATDWTGYYDGVLPCADCSGILTQLWVRSDSTFVLRQRYEGRDSLAFGTIGQWRVVNGSLTVGGRTDKPDLYRATEKGLEMVDEMGQPFASKANYTLEKLAGELQDEVPRMKVSGTFTYMADAMSFKPCGSRFSWPCAGGEQWTDEGEVLGSMNTVELERNYLKAVEQGGDPWVIEVECNMAMGPAMEGDGAEEYIFIHRVLGAAQCP